MRERRPDAQNESAVVSVRALVKNVVFDRVPGLLRRGPSASKRVALTFDDGPDGMTSRYLELLDDLGVPATFFVLGELAAKHPDLVRDYLRRGHQVAGHGYDHTRFTKLVRSADNRAGGRGFVRRTARSTHAR